MADLLNSNCEQIDARLKGLRPIAEEAAGVQAALAALDGTGPAVVASQSVGGTRQRRARPGPARVERGRTREQLVDYVRANPGWTAGEVAKALGLKRNSVATRLAPARQVG
jgi:hypothetical protein